MDEVCNWFFYAQYGKIWTFEIANFNKLQSGCHLWNIYHPLSLFRAILKQTSSLTPCHLADLAGCYCSQLQGLSSSCNHLWQSASVLSPSVPPTSFPSALRGLDLLALRFNPPAQCLASLRPLRPLQRWLKKWNNGDCSSAAHVPMQMEHEWMQILCFHKLCRGPWGWEWAGHLGAQWCPMEALGWLCGLSDLRCVIKPVHSISLWCWWLWGLRPQTLSSRTSLSVERRAARESSCSPVDLQHNHVASLIERKHLVDPNTLSVPARYYTCFPALRSAGLTSVVAMATIEQMCTDLRNCVLKAYFPSTNQNHQAGSMP